MLFEKTKSQIRCCIYLLSQIWCCIYYNCVFHLLKLIHWCSRVWWRPQLWLHPFVLELVKTQQLLLETASLLQVSLAGFVIDFSPLPPSLLVQNTPKSFTKESTSGLQNWSKSHRQCCPRRKNENMTRKPKPVYESFSWDFERLVWILRFCLFNTIIRLLWLFFFFHSFLCSCLNRHDCLGMTCVRVGLGSIYSSVKKEAGVGCGGGYHSFL